MPVPFDVKCSKCGSSLNVVNRTLDSYGDLIVTVAPCEDCQVKAVAEAVAKDKET